MHVDWNWIKQRPHFVVEKMVSNGVNVDLYYQKSFIKTQLTKNPKINVCPKSIPRLPINRFHIIRLINRLIYYYFIMVLLLLKKYDYIYITHPSLYSNSINIPIVYDCMDDVLAFNNTKNTYDEFFKFERIIISQAKYVFFTSEYLMNKVLTRYDVCSNNNFIISNNAIEFPNNKNISKAIDCEIIESNKIKLTYIGTISSWFDFDLLLHLNTEKYTINLYGPIEINKDKYKDNFVFYGPKPRDDIFAIMNNADILIMPFVVNELIRSVNPVKLYEYMYSNKPVIATKYGETEKFQDYIDLYEPSNEDSFENCINDIVSRNMKPKRSKEDIAFFLRGNTWDNRVIDIIKYLQIV